jgi:pimeloyl-ACP methyl ester carboxylesterase
VRGHRCRDGGRLRFEDAPLVVQEAQSAYVLVLSQKCVERVLTAAYLVGHPVILQHGILSNSVTFMVNEERSLAFWLLEQGYDVYCSNIVRTISLLLDSLIDEKTRSVPTLRCLTVTSLAPTPATGPGPSRRLVSTISPPSSTT